MQPRRRLRPQTWDLYTITGKGHKLLACEVWWRDVYHGSVQAAAAWFQLSAIVPLDPVAATSLCMVREFAQTHMKH